MHIRNIRTPFVAAVALILAGAVSLSIADQVVYFDNGKAIMVKKIEAGEDGVTILELEGGGRLGVPTARILKIEEYAVSKPDNGRPPATQQVRTGARTPPPAAPGPVVSGAADARSAAVNEPANLVADAPSVVPVVTGEAAAELAAPRNPAPGEGAPDQAAAAAPPQPQVSGQPGGASAAAAAMAAQQSMAARLQARERNGQLNTPRGRARPGGMQRGQALMPGQSSRRPGQGAVKGGASVPASARGEDEIIVADPERGNRKGEASKESPPPPKDDASEDTPSEAN